MSQGLAAQDTFYVTYRGKALNPSMVRPASRVLLRVCACVLIALRSFARSCEQEQLVSNALQYYLTMAELEKDESY